MEPTPKEDALATMAVACALKETLIGHDVLEAIYDRLAARGHIVHDQPTWLNKEPVGHG